MDTNVRNNRITSFKNDYPQMQQDFYSTVTTNNELYHNLNKNVIKNNFKNEQFTRNTIINEDKGSSSTMDLYNSKVNKYNTFNNNENYERAYKYKANKTYGDNNTKMVDGFDRKREMYESNKKVRDAIKNEYIKY